MIGGKCRLCEEIGNTTGKCPRAGHFPNSFPQYSDDVIVHSNDYTDGMEYARTKNRRQENGVAALPEQGSYIL